MDELSVSVRRIDRTLRVSAVGLFLIVAIWLFRDILLLFFSAVLIGRNRKFIRKPATSTCIADLFSAKGPNTANCAGPE